MFNTIADTCHCLVRHPEKAKFLVVKHAESWAPPTLSFSPGQIDFKAKLINQGMQDKYGLKTRVLRPIIHLPNYHCVEMELASAQSSKKLAAVWVDQAEYMRTRNPPGDVPDPFEVWFQDQASGQVPSNRPPFHQPGWYEQAEHWIQFKLDSLGIQVTGSVEQFRQGWTSSCLLRVQTIQGWIYFKAGYEASPGEAALTAALAKRWPQMIGQPLAIDARKNWLLTQEFRPQNTMMDLQQLPVFARSVARLQLESQDSLDEWQALGCRKLSLDDFVQVSQQPEQFRHIWQEGGGGLTDQEWARLQAALQPIAQECQVLADIGLPLTLVHTNFRVENLTVFEGSHLLLDWSRTLVSHPFLVLGHIFRSHRSALGDEIDVSIMHVDDELHQQVIDAYLQPFAECASRDDLLRGIDAAEKLDRFWMMLSMIYQLEWVEARTPHYFRLIVGLQSLAKQFINRHLSRQGSLGP